MTLTLQREDVARYSVADRVYSVLLDGRRVGEVVRDDVEPSEPGAYRHVWHAWIDPLPGLEEEWSGWDEAVGARTMTRWEAVDELLFELLDLCARLGLAEVDGVREAILQRSGVGACP